MAVTRVRSHETFYGTAADMAAFTLAAQGDIFKQTDTGAVYTRLGAAWVADNMMRIAGRDADGNARAISVVADGSGSYVLRVIDAAPYGYDELTDSIRVQPTGAITPVHTAVNVTTASSVIIAANADRKYLLIVNNSDAEIYINLAGTAASTAIGIVLSSKGSSYEMKSGANLVVGQITAIHASTGNKQIIITEGV